MRISILLLTYLFINPLFAQDGPELHKVKVDVVYLASDYLEGRGTGTKGETLAGEYIVNRFKEIGLEAGGENGSWYQEFPFKLLSNPHLRNSKPLKEGDGKNVLGYLNNDAPYTVVIGAHYDHLGMGETGSRHTGEAAIHNGADDNASGVASMLLLAERLKNKILKKYNYLFIGFSGEEMGLYGSKYFVNNPTIPLESIDALLNMDMIGRLNEEKVLSVNGVGSSPALKEIVKNIAVHGIQTVTTESGIGPSDHASFYLRDVPVLHFFTGQHLDYHKPADDSHLVNMEGVIQVSDFVMAVIEGLDKREKIAFTLAKEAPKREVSAFNVTLGVMPDYVYAGKGMRIDAVLDNRPAKKGGLQNGDVIIKLGETEVKDIYAYMEALAKFNQGETATVVVLRKGKKVKKKVVF